MQLEQLGAFGPSVSRLGLGCNNLGSRLDYGAAKAVVDAALDEGVTFFDTANTYGEGESERYLGRALVDRRGDVVIATKFGGGPPPRVDDGVPRGSAVSVQRSIDASLERLGTDYVDVYYYHFPDGITPFAETVGAVADLIEAGKVRYFACSNLDAGQVAEAHVDGTAKGAPLVALQNEYSLLERSVEEEILPLCRSLGVGFVPYFPLASGLLTGKYRRGEPPPEGPRLERLRDELTDSTFDRLEELTGFAGRHGRSLLELAIGALASTPGVSSVIAGAMSPEQVRANARAVEWQLTEEELAELVGAVPRRA
jgi:aryl-alcohol dehydrogenase-like predicted oxidoreductase